MILQFASKAAAEKMRDAIDANYRDAQGNPWPYPHANGPTMRHTAPPVQNADKLWEIDCDDKDAPLCAEQAVVVKVAAVAYLGARKEDARDAVFVPVDVAKADFEAAVAEKLQTEISTEDAKP